MIKTNVNNFCPQVQFYKRYKKKTFSLKRWIITPKGTQRRNNHRTVHQKRYGMGTATQEKNRINKSTIEKAERIQIHGN